MACGSGIRSAEQDLQQIGARKQARLCKSVAVEHVASSFARDNLLKYRIELTIQPIPTHFSRHCVAFVMAFALALSWWGALFADSNTGGVNASADCCHASSYTMFKLLKQPAAL